MFFWVLSGDVLACVEKNRHHITKFLCRARKKFPFSRVMFLPVLHKKFPKSRG